MFKFAQFFAMLLFVSPVKMPSLKYKFQFQFINKRLIYANHWGVIFVHFRKYWYLRTWQDAVKMGIWLTLIYLSINAPYVITWWNPAPYMYLIGTAAHIDVQISAMTLSIWYFKNKKWILDKILALILS